MKKLILSLLTTTFLLVPINSLAATLKKLPSSESSNQWKVVIGKPDNPGFNKSTNPDLYNLFSMDIKNIGDKNIKLIRIEAYRNEPNSTKEYELFTIENDTNDMHPSFHHHNFPMYTKATELKVILTWTDNSKESEYKRRFREQFVFEQ